MSTFHKTERIVLYLDSSKRVSGTTSNYLIQLVSPVDRVNAVEVIGAEIPYTFYALNNSNNVLVFTDGKIMYNYTMPAGNYSVQTFSDALTAGMDAAFRANAQAAGFTTSFSSTSYQYTLMHHSVPFQLLLAGSTIAPVLGLLANSTLGLSFTMQRVINLSGPNYLFIWSTALAKPKRIRPYVNGTQSNVLYKVPITVNPGDIIINTSYMTDNLLRYGTEQSIQNIDIQLTDPNGIPVDLQGLEWSCTVVLERG